MGTKRGKKVTEGHYLSGGFGTMEAALREALRRKNLKSYRNVHVSVPVRKIEGYYRIRYIDPGEGRR